MRHFSLLPPGEVNLSAILLLLSIIIVDGVVAHAGDGGSSSYV